MLSEKPWKGEAVLRLVLGLFVAFGIGGLAVEIVEKFGAKLSSIDRQFIETVCLTISFQGLGLVLVAWFLREQQLSWSAAFGFRSSSPVRVILLGAIAGLLVLPIAWGLQELSVSISNIFDLDTTPQEIIKKLQSGKETPSHQAYLFFVAVLVAPVIEEILFRGIFYPTIKQLGFRRIAFWGTAALFAATHMNVQTFLPLFFFAVILTLLYEETDNLLTPIIAHSAFNAANFLLLVFKEPLTELFHKVV